MKSGTPSTMQDLISHEEKEARNFLKTRIEKAKTDLNVTADNALDLLKEIKDCHSGDRRADLYRFIQASSNVKLSSKAQDKLEKLIEYEFKNAKKKARKSHHAFRESLELLELLKSGSLLSKDTLKELSEHFSSKHKDKNDSDKQMLSNGKKTKKSAIRSQENDDQNHEAHDGAQKKKNARKKRLASKEPRTNPRASKKTKATPPVDAQASTSVTGQ